MGGLAASKIKKGGMQKKYTLELGGGVLPKIHVMGGVNREKHNWGTHYKCQHVFL